MNKTRLIGHQNFIFVLYVIRVYFAHAPGSYAGHHDSLSEQPADSKSVIILTYQRCGSSFFGTLFNFDTQAFYVFEPLDSLYSFLYGTTPGWNVPSDIFSFPNGTDRPIPPRELVAVVDFLRHLLSCDVDKLPVDTLVHPYFHMRRNEMLSLLYYESCLRNVHLTKEAVLECYERLPGLCSLRFGSHGPDALELCHRLLHQANESFHPRFIRQLDNFTECISKCRERVNDLCSPLLKSACSSRRLRVAKVVRASMESMELLLRTLPGSKVIHLVRDPRAVALSRYVFTPSTRGHTWNIARDKTEKLATEASIYCRRVVADVRWRHLLEQRFPDRLLSLTYEDVVSDPIKQATDIYRFIKDVDVPAKAVYMFAYLAKVGRRNMSAVDLASKWRRELKPSELKQINEKCKELIKIYPQYAEIDVSRPDDDET